MKVISYLNKTQDKLPDGVIDVSFASTWDLLWNAIKRCDYKLIIAKSLTGINKCFKDTDPAFLMITLCSVVAGFMGSIFGFMDMRVTDLTFFLAMKRGMWNCIRLEFVGLFSLIFFYELYHIFLRLKDWAEEYIQRHSKF